jgi:hypothetical protein
VNVSQIAERMDVKEEYVREWLGDNAGKYKPSDKDTKKNKNE